MHLGTWTGSWKRQPSFKLLVLLLGIQISSEISCTRFSDLSRDIKFYIWMGMIPDEVGSQEHINWEVSPYAAIFWTDTDYLILRVSCSSQTFPLELITREHVHLICILTVIRSYIWPLKRRSHNRFLFQFSPFVHHVRGAFGKDEITRSS